MVNAQVFAVPTTPIRFTVPAHCKLCGSRGSVTAETTIAGGTVIVKWCCRACGRDWPITRGEAEATERRTAATDRRRTKRSDRRAT